MDKFEKVITEIHQTEKARDDQIKNEAGGYVYQANDWQRLERFLILGTSGGTYYATERAVTKENVDFIVGLIKTDPKQVIDRTVAISDAGRAPKNDPALFVWALVMHYGDKDARIYAGHSLRKIARIGTHLFHAAHYLRELRRNEGKSLTGTVVKKAFGDWYVSRSEYALARQLVKYKQRDGWSHRDVLRIAHPKPTSEAQGRLFAYATEEDSRKKLDHILSAGSEAETYIAAHHEAMTLDPLKDRDRLIRLIDNYRMPHRAIQTYALRDPLIWDALIEHMGPWAILRELGNMTRHGYIKPLSDGSEKIIKRLTDKELIHRSRLHPVQVLTASITYSSGRGVRGKFIWTPDPAIVAALEDTFYESFKCVEPTNKRYFLGIDVSSSMMCGTIAGVPNLSPAMGAAAMSMVWARTEPKTYTFGFTHEFRDLGITAKDTIGTVLGKVQDRAFGKTDCSLPMLYAANMGIEADVFIVLTDNETWAGRRHPDAALRDYRQKMGIDAKLVVVGMTANKFSIADPNDPGMMDVVGFDTSVPQVVAGFVED